MANDDFDLDLEGFDDSALDMPDFDGSMGDGDAVGSRSPALKFKQGFIEGAGAHLQDKDNYIGAVERALPSSYGRLKDKGMEVVDVFDKLRRDTTAQLKPEIKKIKLITQKLMPAAERFLPASFAEKIKTFSEQEPSKEAFEQTNADELKLQNTLADIFNKQQEQRAEDGARESAEKAYEENTANRRTQLIIHSQDTTKSLIARLVSYQDNITARYQKESLELQFRHYFVARDLFQISTASYKDIIIRLDEIKQNTGLPDIQKIQKSEVWKQGIMDEFFGKKGEAVGKILDSYWDTTKKNIYTSIKSKFDTAMEYVSMPLDAIEDMTGMMEGVDMGVSQEEMAGSMAGDYFSQWIINKVFKPIGNYLQGNETIQKGARSADYILANLGSVITEYSTRDYDNPLLNKLAQGVRSVIPSQIEPTEEIGKRLRTTGLEPAFYDVATRRSIIEVIPGFLSRIHQGIMRIATGDDNYPRLTFDSTKEEFITVQQASAALKEKLSGGGNKRRMQNALDYFYDEIDKDNALTEQEKQLISLNLIKKTGVANTGQFNPDALYEQDFYDESIDIPSKTLDKIRSLLEGRYKRTKRGELDISSPELASITKKYLDISYAHANVQDIINNAQAFGETDILRETGLLKTINGEEIFDKDKYRQDLLGLANKPIESPKLPNASMIKPQSNAVLDAIKDSNEELFYTLYEIKENGVNCNLPGMDNANAVMSQLSDSVQSINNTVFTISNTMGDLILRTEKANHYLKEIKNSNEELFYTLYEIKEQCLDCDQSSDTDNRLQESIYQSLIKVNESLMAMNTLSDDFYKQSIAGIANVGSVNTLADSQALTNNLLEAIKTFNEAHYFDVDRLFETESYTDFDSVRQLLEATAISVDEIDNYLKQMDITSVSSSLSLENIAGLEDHSDPDKIRTFKQDVLELLGSVNKGIIASVEATVESTKALLTGLGDINIDDSITRLFKKSITGIGGITKLGMTGVFKGIGGFFGGIGQSFKIGAGLFKDDGIRDIYVTGDEEPRLLSRKLRKRNYIDTVTKKPIQFIDDIKHPVCDASDSMAIVITEEDLKKGLYINAKEGALRTVTRDVYSFGKSIFSGTGGAMAGLQAFYKKMKSFSVKIAREISGITDVYVVGEKDPRLLAVVIRRGGYISVTTGKPIFSLGDIDGPIADATGKIVLAIEDLPHLYDVNGNRLELSTLSEKVLSFFVKTGKGTYEIAKNVVMTGYNIVKKMVMAPLNLAKKLGLKGYEKSKAGLKRSVIYLAKKMGYDISRIGDEKEEAPLAELLANEQVNVLKKIYNLLNRRIPKQTKMKKGSWQQQFADDDNEEQTAINQERLATKKSHGIQSIGGKLGTVSSRAAANEAANASPMNDDSSGIGDALGTVASTAGGGLLTYIATKFAIGGAATTAASTAATAASTGALTVGALTALPWVAGAATVAAAGYGAMLLWDRRPPSEIQELRMMQYGVLKNEYNRLAIVREFEDRMSDNITIIDQSITIKKDSITLLKENYELFDVNAHSRARQQLWLNWYENRFLPIFKRHYSASLEGGLKNLDNIEDQNPISKVEYIKRVTPDKLNAVYRLFDTPFSDGEITVDPTQITQLKNVLLKKYEQKHKALLSTVQPSDERTKESYEKEAKDGYSQEEKKQDTIQSLFSSFSNKIAVFFKGPSLEPDTRIVGLIETYRLLQYGINPHDDYQVQPIRALEHFCFDVMGFNYQRISKVTPYSVLMKVEKFFPIDKGNQTDANAWLYWYTQRFLPIYVKYLKFIEKEKIKDFFDIERVAQSSKLPLLVMAVNPTGYDIDPYDVISSPFGGYKLSVTTDVIYEFKQYLLNLKAPEKIELKLGDTSPDAIRAYQQQMSARSIRSQDVSKGAQTIINKAPVTNVSRQFSPWRSSDDNLISLMPPVDAQPNSLYGIRKDPITGEIKKHLGVDYAAPKGTPIRAAADGKIIKKYESDSYGNVIFIEHNDGLVTKYAHMSRFNDAFGLNDVVKTGEIIGYVGNTGKSSGNHLHFELRKGPDQNAASYDPLEYMKLSDSHDISESIFDNAAKGGDDLSMPDYSKKHPIVEDYSQIVSKETEKSIQQKNDTVLAQRAFEHKLYTDKLDTLASTLQEQLNVQIDICDYLQSIKTTIESIHIPIIEQPITQPPKGDTQQTVHYKLPTKQSVTPALSMKRRKYRA